MTNSKTHWQAKNIVCSEPQFDEFPELMFGADIDGTIYFDATSYLQEKYPEDGLTVEEFMQKCDFQIQCIAESYQLDSNSLCLLNQEGHQLIIGYLCYPFLSYTDHKFYAYVNEMIHEVFVNDIFISDKFLIKSMNQRFSKELIQKLISKE